MLSALCAPQRVHCDSTLLRLQLHKTITLFYISLGDDRRHHQQRCRSALGRTTISSSRTPDSGALERTTMIMPQQVGHHSHSSATFVSELQRTTAGNFKLLEESQSDPSTWSHLGFGSNQSNNTFGGSTLFGGSNTGTTGGFGSGGTYGLARREGESSLLVPF